MSDQKDKNSLPLLKDKTKNYTKEELVEKLKEIDELLKKANQEVHNKNKLN